MVKWFDAPTFTRPGNGDEHPGVCGPDATSGGELDGRSDRIHKVVIPVALLKGVDCSEPLLAWARNSGLGLLEDIRTLLKIIFGETPAFLS